MLELDHVTVEHRLTLDAADLRAQRRWNKLMHQVAREVRDMVAGERHYHVGFAFDAAAPQKGAIYVSVEVEPEPEPVVDEEDSSEEE